MRVFPISLLALLAGITHAQQLSEIPQGLRDATPRWHALTGARLVLAPGQVIENGTLVISIATQPALYEKMISNMVEVKARGGT